MHVGIAKLRRWGKRSRHSRRMRNPQYYISGKRPMRKMLERIVCSLGMHPTKYTSHIECIHNNISYIYDLYFPNLLNSYWYCYRLTNTNEMGCFTQAFVEISKHLKYDDIFEDIDEKTAADAKKEVKSYLGTVSMLRRSFYVKNRIPIIKKRLWWDRLIFIMGIPILIRCILRIETANDLQTLGIWRHVETKWLDEYIDT